MTGAVLPVLPLREQAGALLAVMRDTRTQQVAADLIGMARAPLARLEAGEANPTLDRLERIAADYGYAIELRAVPLHPDGRSP